MRRALSIASTVVAVVLLPAPAWAGIGGGNGGGGGTTASAGGGGVAVGLTGSSASPVPTGAAPSTDCVENIIPGTTEPNTELHTTDGYWVYNSCDVNGAGGAIFWVPTPPKPDPIDVARQAEASAPWPTIAPSMDPSPEKLLVHLPIWMRLTSGWQDVSATATTGGVTATIAAKPQQSTWDMGDGAAPTVCATKGKAYNPSKSWSANLHNRTCGYEYDQASTSSHDGRFTVTVTIRYAVTWTSSTGASGSLGTFDRTQTLPVSVGQLDSLEN